MTTYTATSESRRPGVTLVELLVVVALMIVLLGMAVVIGQSGVFGSQKVVGSADQASSWLVVARQRAIRDGLPRGVRFILRPVTDPLWNPSGDAFYFAATEAQYIEAPEPWVPNLNGSGNPDGARIAFVYWHDPATNALPNAGTHRQIHFIGSAAELSEFDQRVAIYDSLYLPDLNAVCRILGVAPASVTHTVNGTPTPFPSRLITLDAPAPAPPTGSYPNLGAGNSGPVGSPPVACHLEYNFGFLPAPRPLVGEPSLQMSGGTVIDCRVGHTAPYPGTTYGTFPIPDGAGNYHIDLLFSASGSLMYSPSGIVCLWVRDPALTPHPRLDYAQGVPAGIDARSAYDAAGEQSLITIYAQTGNVANHPPAWLAPYPNNDPYRYAKDGIGSGF